MGRGGRGEGWEAEQQSLSRRVARKLLRPDRVDERGLDFFAREARAGGRLAHQGVGRGGGRLGSTVCFFRGVLYASSGQAIEVLLSVRGFIFGRKVHRRAPRRPFAPTTYRNPVPVLVRGGANFAKAGDERMQNQRRGVELGSLLTN